MSHISNIKINGESITFDLNNFSKEIKISFANSLRRTILSYINTYIIDNNSIIFYENNSILNNEFLKHRLTLIPIISDIKDIDYDNIVISCKKENEEEYIQSIYVDDFICMDTKKNVLIDNNIIFKYPKILFCKLKNNQQISFESKLINGTTEYSGAFHTCVSVCFYTFKIDQEKVNEITSNMTESDKIRFNTQENERIYEKNSIGEPNVYNFSIESNGFYEPLKIVKLGIDILLDRLNIIKIELRNPKSKKITLIENIENPDFYDFLIDHEDETVGNLLSTYITYNPEVFYCGYIIEHPLKYNILLRLKLKENNTLDNNIKIIENNIDTISNLLIKCNNELI